VKEQFIKNLPCFLDEEFGLQKVSDVDQSKIITRLRYLLAKFENNRRKKLILHEFNPQPLDKWKPNYPSIFAREFLYTSEIQI
jgi:hypothetical protein